MVGGQAGYGKSEKSNSEQYAIQEFYSWSFYDSYCIGLKI
jgi:hypothetical protein